MTWKRLLRLPLLSLNYYVREANKKVRLKPCSVKNRYMVSLCRGSFVPLTLSPEWEDARADGQRHQEIFNRPNSPDSSYGANSVYWYR